MSKTILITGSSTGIGRATAMKFQEEGWNVIATMRTPEKEEELSKLENVLVTKLDVTDLNSIDSAINAGIEKFGKIDALVNNAGYGAYGPLEAFKRENILRQFNTNVIGLLDVSRAILSHFRANKSGTIVNISSIGGKMTFPLGSLYHGTKFAVEGITEAMVYEAEAIGVKMKIVEPGAIATDFGGRSFDFSNDESMKEYQKMVNGLMAGFGEALSNASPASLCAGVIYEAVTDGTNKLRYAAGPDADQMLPARAATSDEDWAVGIKQRFGL
jgi:NADP-dependent 3-hydroxy acid dehydrogenase YdfG